MYTNDEFFRVFGHISIFFATWDFFVTAIITRLVRLDCRVGDLASATLGQKLRFLQRLRPEQTIDGDLLRQIQSVLTAAIAKSQMRNRFIHDQWVFKPELIAQGRIERLELRIGMNPQGRPFDLRSESYTIQQLYDFLGKLGDQQQIFARFLAALPDPVVPKG